MGMNREPDELELSSDLRQAAAVLRERFGRCPEPPMLQASGAGVLPPEVNRRVITHIETCPVCKSLVQDLAHLDEAPLQEQGRNRIWSRIQAGIAAERPTSRVAPVATRWWNSFFRPWPITAAATAVIILGACVFVGIKLMHGAQDRQEASNRLPEPTPSQSPTTPAESMPSTSPSNAFRLEKAPVRLPATAAMVWRGQPEGDEGQTERLKAQTRELEQALVPYRADNYSEAEPRLERVAQKYPRLAEPRFYLGVCQLFLNKNQDAAATLKTARGLAHQPLAADAAWYLALAYHRSGQDSEARPLLEKLCHSGRKDSARACAAQGELSPSQ